MPARTWSAIIVRVSSPLSGIPVAKRRRVAATLGLFAMLFIAVGVVGAAGPATALVKGFAAVALLVALLLGLMAWGVLRSIKQDLHERQLDAVIAATMASRGRSLCDCGVEHDPTELYLVGDEYVNSVDACQHDGTGTDCAHSCDECVLAAMRPSPHTPRVERLRSD